MGREAQVGKWGGRREGKWGGRRGWVSGEGGADG